MQPYRTYTFGEVRVTVDLLFPEMTPKTKNKKQQKYEAVVFRRQRTVNE